MSVSRIPEYEAPRLSFLRRISQVLTPTPAKRSGSDGDSVGGSSVWETGEREFQTEIRRCVREVVVNPSEDPALAAQAFKKLEEVAATRGVYAAAAQIRIQLDSFDHAGDIRVQGAADRTYRLAGDLILRQMLREIDATKTHQFWLGPNVISEYCNDAVDCMLEGHSIPRAVEVPVLVAERLVSHAIDSVKNKKAYLLLAIPAVERVLDTLDRHLDDALLRMRQEALQRRRGTDTPVEIPRDHAERNTVLFLHNFHKALLVVRDGFLACPLTPTVPGPEIPRDAAPESLAQHLSYLQELQCIGKTAGMLTACAMIKERAAVILRSLQNVEKGRRCLIGAANAYEAEANAELAANLKRLALMRYRKAYHLFTVAQDAPHAARIKAMYEQIERG